MSDEALLALMESQRRKLENYRVQTIELRQQVAALASRLAANHRFEDSPCPICDYNGEGYYQPEKHPCAAIYHAANRERGRTPTQKKIDEVALSALCPNLTTIVGGAQ